MLQTNPNLGWRDVQNILINTSTKNDPTEAGWVQNGDDRWFNHAYGYGRIDASAAVLAASTWSNLPPNATPVSASHTANLAIPDNNATGISDTITISGQDAFVIEHVEVTFNATHTYRGDIGIVLESPSGMKSTLTELHDDAGNDYSNWIFTSIAHWGEHPNGTWKIYVSDLFAEDTGTFNNWTLTLHGRTVATPTPTATETPTPSPSASISPTASPVPTESLTPTPSPTASFTPSLTASPTASPSPTASATASPSPTESPSPTATETETATPTPSPSPSPTSIPTHVEFDFAPSEQGWTFFNPATFATVTGGHDHEAGAINSVLTENTNSFAYWESPTFLISPSETLPSGTLGENVIPITGVVGPPSLYRSAFTVKGNVAEAATVPTIRVRSSAFNFEQSDVLVITSAGNGNLSPDAAGKSYIQYFSQPAGVDSFRLDFDVLNFDPTDASNATLALDAVAIDSIGTPQVSGTPVASLDFSAGTQGFTARNAVPLLEVPAHYLTNGGGLGIRGADPVRGLAPAGTIFGYWGAETSIPVIGGKLYAFTFSVSSDATSEQRTQVPTFRMRINDSSLKLSAYVNIDSRDNATRVPVNGNPENYVLWVQVPQEVDGQNLIFSFDYLWTPETDDNATITLTLENLAVAYFETAG
jgi:subtilisin-like proprotein convertase family protein